MHPSFANVSTTIFSEMSALAARHDALNLGQGFPEVDGAPELRAIAARALVERSNQYAPTRGLPELCQAVAEHYGRLFGVPLDGASEVLVTSGATEGLAAALLALVSPGEEVVCFEPVYDAYSPLVARAGGTLRLGRLEPPHFDLTAELLEQTLTPRTKLVLLTTPHNPGTSCIRLDALEPLVRQVQHFGTRVLCDEVWEHVVLPGARHRSLLSMPGLEGHVLKVGSAGKMFALTGWKIGFLCGAAPLVTAAARAHQYLTFASPPALQWAVTEGLRLPAEYFAEQSRGFALSRERFERLLQAEGIAYLPGEGTYFLNVDLRASGCFLSDLEFARRAVKEFGIATIPLSAFYLRSGVDRGQALEPPSHLLRLCFAKTDATLEEGARRLGRAVRALRERGG
jgi:aspartate/methionine/tyrosine aminotransferase